MKYEKSIVSEVLDQFENSALPQLTEKEENAIIPALMKLLSEQHLSADIDVEGLLEVPVRELGKLYLVEFYMSKKETRIHALQWTEMH